MTFLELSKTLISLLILLTILKIIPATKVALSALTFSRKKSEKIKGGSDDGNTNTGSNN